MNPKRRFNLLKEPLKDAPFEGWSRFVTAQVRPELAASLETREELEPR